MNDKKIKNIAKNTSYLTLAFVIQKVFSFIYFVFLARNLGPEILGKYYFAISLTTIFAIFIDLGLVNYLTREVAKDREGAKNLLSNVLGLKIISSLFSIAAVFIFINILGDHDILTKQLVYISVISMVLDSFTLTFFGSARGRHNLKYESISSVVFQMIVLALGYYFVSTGQDIRLIMAALAFASLFNFIYSFLILKFKIKIPIKVSFNLPFAKSMILVSLPFALYGIFQRLHTYLDSVLLSYFTNDYYVGVYQVSFKIIFALQFLPMAFVASLYPAMSFYWKNNREQLKITFRRSLDYLLLISVPISSAIFLLSDKIILIFKEGYSEANWPLRISIIALIFIFLNFPLGSLLNACDLQSRNTRNMFISLLSSIILNIILIPKFQVIGASIAVLFSNFLMFFLNSIECKKLINYNYKENFITLFKVLLATTVMSVFIFIFKDSFNIFVLCVLAFLVYASFLIIFGGIKRGELIYLFNSFKLKK